MTEQARVRAFGVAAVAIAVVTAVLMLLAPRGEHGSGRSGADSSSGSGRGRPTIVQPPPALVEASDAARDRGRDGEGALGADRARRRAVRAYVARELADSRLVSIDGVEGDPRRVTVVVVRGEVRTTFVLTLESRDDGWRVTAVQ